MELVDLVMRALGLRALELRALGQDTRHAVPLQLIVNDPSFKEQTAALELYYRHEEQPVEKGFLVKYLPIDKTMGVKGGTTVKFEADAKKFSGKLYVGELLSGEPESIVLHDNFLPMADIAATVHYHPVRAIELSLCYVLERTKTPDTSRYEWQKITLNPSCPSPQDLVRLNTVRRFNRWVNPHEIIGSIPYGIYPVPDFYSFWHEGTPKPLRARNAAEAIRITSRFADNGTLPEYVVGLQITNHAKR